MSRPLEDYALVGDTHTAALVSRAGSVDWLCVPNFDSPACFAALLGSDRHGHWSIAPADPAATSTRRYRGNTLVLETTFTCTDGRVRVTDCMPIRDECPDFVRRVEGIEGKVGMQMHFRPRMDYGQTIPWMERERGRLHAVAGPNRLTVDADVPFEVHSAAHATSEFAVSAGDTVDFELRWWPSHIRPGGVIDVGQAIEGTESWWLDWSRQCQYAGGYSDAVMRSLITLKALTYHPTGGIVAAPTTSLPESLGGSRNWDYRYCWIRDATYTLLALLEAGYDEEAKAWREWLLRAVAGAPDQMQIMYGVDGRRQLVEFEVDGLPGYGGSRPVRVGNAASDQRQLDVYGELMDALHQARRRDIPPDAAAWRVQRELMDFLEGAWREPDAGIWEMRGGARQFTHSKVLAWVAADRAVHAVERFGIDGPATRWRALRQEIFDDVCARGYDPDLGSFTQYYGSGTVDAALLRIPHVGFLPATDERVRGTVAAVEKNLMTDGLVRRYATDGGTDGMPHGEATFLPCSFWLADNYIMQGERGRGRELFEQLLELRNDVGLLAEEYDPSAGRLLGNFPQALSHIPLVNTAFLLAGHGHGR